jgi:hypothetical protein
MGNKNCAGQSAPVRRRPRCRAGCARLGLAGRWGGAAGVLDRRQPVRGRAASRHRHRARRCENRARSSIRRSVVRGTGADARPHGHDRYGRRLQGVPDPSRPASGPSRRSRRGERPDRGGRTVRRCRVRHAVRPPRNPAAGRRDVHRPSLAPSAASGDSPAGPRGAARASARSRSRATAGAGTCTHPRAGAGSGPRPCSSACSTCGVHAAGFTATRDRDADSCCGASVAGLDAAARAGADRGHAHAGRLDCRRRTGGGVCSGETDD